MDSSDSWKRVKKKCHLDETEIRMAQEMGLSPKAVMRMIPDPKEKWKDPVPLRIRRLYDRKH